MTPPPGIRPAEHHRVGIAFLEQPACIGFVEAGGEKGRCQKNVEEPVHPATLAGGLVRQRILPAQGMMKSSRRLEWHPLAEARDEKPHDVVARRKCIRGGRKTS